MPTRLRKVRKLRGSRTHGFGQIGQHRHSGAQGGHGNAGLHKHKWSWMTINDPDHFSKDQYAVPGARKVAKWLNVGELEAMRTASSKDPHTVDLTALGVEKLLGSGTLKHAFNIKVEAFTERAKTKVEEAGGKIIV
jgi:large subunit ribosomal protein L15